MATRPPAMSTDDGGKRLQDDRGFVVGVATGAFGVLAVFALALLPASTRSQQAFILIACLALSMACAVAPGAWRSMRRFAIASASMVTAVICLAALAVVTESAVPGTASADRGSGSAGDATSGHPTPSPDHPTGPTAPAGTPPNEASPSAAATPQPGPAVVYLANLEPVEGDPKTGGRSVFATTYEHSVVLDSICYEGLVGYNLNRRYRRFQAVMGLADTGPSGVEIRFEVTLDGKRLPGSNHTLTVSQTRPLNLDVTNGNRLVLRAESPNFGCWTPGEGVEAVWADARVS